MGSALIAGVIIISATAPVSASGWSTWSKFAGNPVYEHNDNGVWNVASDPSVIKDGSTYRLIVSGDAGIYAGSTEGNSIIMATSDDGIAWQTLDNGKNGMVATGTPGAWNESMELPDLIKNDGEYLLFYCGYDPARRDSSGGLEWGDLGLAISTDAAAFTVQDTPVMRRTPGWYDQDGITDPTVTVRNDTLYMVYVGWCAVSCSRNGGEPAFYSLTAVSTDAGRSWIKKGLLDTTGAFGLQHPDITVNDGGTYSLFYGIDGACSADAIGIFHATAPAPFGPYTQSGADPILCLGTQPFETTGTDGGFPTVINDQGRGRMWYTGVDESVWHFRIGLAETELPSTTANRPQPHTDNGHNDGRTVCQYALTGRKANAAPCIVINMRADGSFSKSLRGVFK